MTHFHQRLYFVKLIERFTNNCDADNTVTFEQNLLQVFNVWYMYDFYGMSCNTKSHTLVLQKILGKIHTYCISLLRNKDTQLNDKECE